MPFPRPSLTALRSQAMQDITASDLPNADGFLRRSAMRVLAWVQAGMAHLHYGYLDWMCRQAVPFTAEGEFLEAWAAMAPTPVLRQGPKAASGLVTWSGVAGTPLPGGTPCARSDLVAFLTVGNATVGSGGTVLATVQAVAPGSAGNTDTGTPFSLSVVVPGITSTGFAFSIITGGTDLEQDASMRTRMLESYAAPPHGGNAADYVTWALGVPGVTRAWCKPGGMGPGTVVVYFMMDAAEAAHGGFPQGVNGVASLEGRALPATGDQLAVANAIYPLRPVTAVVYAVSPTPLPQNFAIPALVAATPTQMAQVATALSNLFLNLDSPLGTTSIQQSDCNNAIETVAGLPPFAITVPSAWPLTSPVGALLTLGTVNNAAAVVVSGPGSPSPPTTPPALPPQSPNLLPGGSGNPAAPAPISGAFAVTGWTYQTYAGMAYIRMLPANYDPSKRYPLVVFTHTDDDGNAYYQGGITADQQYGVAAKFQQYFQSDAFQRQFPCVWIAPLLDQRAQGTDGQINFGGHSYFGPPGLNGGDQLAGHRAVIALIKYEITQHPIDVARIYTAGASMGGDGVVVNMLLDNTLNGTEEADIFAAGLALSPVDYDIISSPDNGATWTVSPAAVAQCQAGVPLGLIHGASDTNHPASYMSLPLYKALGGTNANASGMPWTRAGTSNVFLLIDPALGHDTWDTYLTGSNLLTYFGWLFSRTATAAPSFTPSPSGTTVNAGSTGSLTDSAGEVVTITAGGQVAFNGVADPTTANVTQIAYVNGLVYQENQAGNWWSEARYGAGWTSTISPFAPPLQPTSGAFSVSNGKIYTPAGAVFKAKGVNITDGAMASACTSAAGGPLLSQFPGLNFVRVACYSYQPPSYYTNFVTWMTGLGVYVAFENHQNFNADGSSAGNYGGGQGFCNTGSILTAETNWYAALAANFKNNSLVGFLTSNEPSVTPSVAALSTWHDAIIGAIRATGSNALIGVDVNNPNTWGVGNGMTPSVYAKYRNLYWDPHLYGWLWTDGGQIGGGGYSTNMATITAQLQQGMQLLQSIHSADGVMPCIVGEYGDSTEGPNRDPNGLLNVQATQASAGTVTAGCAAWLWDYLGPNFHDALQTGNGTQLSDYGQEVAGWIASA